VAVLSSNQQSEDSGIDQAEGVARAAAKAYTEATAAH
jgi:hypothetical protein